MVHCRWSELIWDMQDFIFCSDTNWYWSKVKFLFWEAALRLCNKTLALYFDVESMIYFHYQIFRIRFRSRWRELHLTLSGLTSRNYIWLRWWYEYSCILCLPWKLCICVSIIGDHKCFSNAHIHVVFIEVEFEYISVKLKANRVCLCEN